MAERMELPDDDEEESGALTPEDKAEGETKPHEAEELVTRWLKELDKAAAHEEKWRDRAKKLVKRYRDEEKAVQAVDDENAAVTFNILFANTQVLKGQYYQKTPTPDVRRRFADKDPLGRRVASILQRAISTTLDSYDFDEVMMACVEDRLLPGRGVARLAYKPTMAQVPLGPGPDGQPQLNPDGTPATVEQVVYEEVVCDYVEWAWFRMSPATRWKKVRWIAFGELLTKKELKEQFGEEIAARCTLDWAPEDKEDDSDLKRALVWVIWDKTSRKMYAISKGLPEMPLRVLDDPLQLEGFWPIPKPLYASTATTCSLIPVPEYVQYQSLAIELDVVTERIAKLVDALRRRGIYDTSQPELARLASAGDNEFVPAENYAALLEKGGVAALFAELPIEGIAKVLVNLYTQRDQIKAIIYEVTGISDIVRGSTQASETLGAQELKARYSNTRVATGQKEVAKFARDIIRITGEIIAERFSPETLKLMTGPELWVETRKVPDPIAGQETEQQVDLTNDIMQLLRNEKLRGFRVDIETDSTIEPDAGEEQKNRIEFLTAVTSYIEQAGPLVTSGAMPMDVAKDFLSFGARGFKVSPQLEDAIDRLGGDQKQAEAGKAQQQQQAQALAAAERRKVEAEAAEAEAKARKVDLECQILERQLMAGVMPQPQATPGAVMSPQAALPGADQGAMQ